MKILATPVDLAVTMFFAAIVLSSCGPGQTAYEGSAEKPNIIFLLTDDHRWDALGIMGNTIIQTPNLDRLAKEGIYFRNAYVTTAICAVSRASILTGQYLSRHGIADFTTSFDSVALHNTYPILLKKAGYTIGFVGKYGVGKPGEQPKDLYDFWDCSNKIQPDYEMKDDSGNYLHHTDKVAGDVKRFLDQMGSREPFCLSVSFKAPHVQDNDRRQFIASPEYKSYYADVTIPVPETADPKYWNQFPDFFRTDKNIARERWKMRFATQEMYQESVKNYYRLLTHVDDVVGDLLKQLEAEGLADNTVIIFTGDNGMYLGEHGLAGKWYGHEESIRVPLIIYDPRKDMAMKGIACDNIALNIDVAPTILNLAGVRAPKAMQGVDLVGLAEGNDLPERRDFFYEHTFMGSPGIPKVEGVVSLEMKYMKFIEHDYEELYDLKADRLEKKNLAGEEEYERELERWRKRYIELKESVK
ncbi:MAG TPA: sulfatase [Chryseosolibacter sp.]|nr:sulfatase [Chryseosolibacter sp.]